MGGWKTGFLILALAALVSGCVPSQQGQRMEQDLGEVKRRLAQNEKELNALRRHQSQGTDQSLGRLSRQQADLQAGIDAVRVQVQSIDGRVEELARQEAKLKQQMPQLQKDLGPKVADLQQRVGKVEDRLGKLEATVQKVAARPAPQATEQSPRALYEHGLELIRKKRAYAEGQKVMREFLHRYPKHKLAINATYWIGEALYGEKKYEEAILQFQDVIQKYGHQPKVAAALVKQGLAFHALGDNKNAEPILQKVIKAYPRSSEAKKAKEFLQAWKRKKK